MNIEIKTRNGFINEMREVEIISVDGVPFEQLMQPSITNHEHRLQMLEEVVSGIMESMASVNQPSPQNEQLPSVPSP